jgi:hypothetical protein
MPANTAQQRQVLPATCGRDEVNLIDYPISILKYQQPVDQHGKRPDELVCTVDCYDSDLGEIVPRKLTRRTSSKHGFPTPLEDEVLIALLTLTRVKNDFKQPRVTFRNGELYELMGWPRNGTSNNRLSVALDRLTGLKLKYENSWTSQDGTFQKEFTTGLLDSYNFVKQTHGRRNRDHEESWIQWASEVFVDIQRGNVKELNTVEFFSLHRPVSQRMYRFLDKHLSHEQHFEMDLVTFAEHLGLSETRHIGKIKERLAPSLSELESLQTFIAPETSETRYHKRGPGRWLVRFNRPEPLLKIEAATNTSSQPSNDDTPRTLVSVFYEAWRGVKPSRISKKELDQASTLVARYGSKRLFELLPKVAKTLKRHFPEARAFGASMIYWDEVMSKSQHAEQQTIDARSPESDCEKHQDIQQPRRNQLRREWQSLSEGERNNIVDAVAASGSDTVSRFISHGKLGDPLVEIACLQELERRSTDSDMSSVVASGAN